MKHPGFLAWAALTALVSVWLGGCGPDSADEEAVRDLWREYIRVNEEADGEGLASMVSANTIEFYDRLLANGLNAPRTQVELLPPTAMAEVFLMRTLGKRRDLEKLNGRSYIVYAASNGWYQTGAEDTSVVESVEVRGDTAYARISDADDWLTGKVRFYREEGVWKIDETSCFDMWDRWEEKIAREWGQTVVELILDWTHEHTGVKPGAGIWEPMK